MDGFYEPPVERRVDISPSSTATSELSQLTVAAWVLLLSTFSGNLEVPIEIECRDSQRNRAQKTVIQCRDQPTGEFLAHLPAIDPSLRVTAAVDLSGPAEGGDLIGCRLELLQHNEGEDTASLYSDDFEEDTLRPLTITARITQNSICLALDRYPVVPPIANKMLASMECTLRDLLDGQSSLNHVSPLTTQDQQLISSWNSLRTDITACSLPRLVDNSIGDSPAICSWDGAYTYSELEDISNGLARYLVGRGSSKGETIALCFEKSKIAVVSLLAALKAGFCIVVLDPTYPLGRIETILKASRASTILAASGVCWSICQKFEMAVEVSTTFLADCAISNEQPLPSIAPDSPAFIIYTSGSTGQPKGIVLSHGALSTAIQTHGPILAVSRASRVLQFAAYPFDVSLAETFLPLSKGGCVCIPSEDQRKNNLADAIRSLHANHLVLTSTVANILDPEELPHVRVLTLTAEPMKKSVLQRWASRVRVQNAYGPTECSIWSTITPPLGKHESETNIGRGAGTMTWVVSPHDHNLLLPIGAVGELLIEGPLLANGYLNNAEQTGLSFIENPRWSQRSGSKAKKFYKTGDLVSYSDTGSLHFHGRKDAQVKVRGYRIELGEIEHQIDSHDRETMSVVTLPSAGRYRNQLVALLARRKPHVSGKLNGHLPDHTVIPASDHAALPLRDYLEKKLPPYMIPSIFITVEQVPMLLSGKLDRARARQWIERLEENSEAEDEAPLEPVSATEQILQTIWASVLGLKSGGPSVNENFFALGGDSIAAMQIVSRCRTAGLITDVSSIFKAATISGLAATVQHDLRHQNRRAYEETEEIRFALSPIQRLFFRIAPHAPDSYNQNLFVELSAGIDYSPLEKALNAIVSRHGMLRARFHQSLDGGWSQSISNFASNVQSLQTSSAESEQDVYGICREMESVLNIREGPVFLSRMITLDGKQYLYLLAHHLVIDLVSWRVILNDLEEFLTSRSLRNGRPTPFSIWSGAQTKRFGSDTPDQLTETDMSPIDRSFWFSSTDNNNFGETFNESFLLDLPTSRALLTKSSTAKGTEPIDTFLSAVGVAFRRVFHDWPMPSIYNEGHGREAWDSSLDVSDTVSWFTTISAIDIQSGSWDGVDLLDVIREISRARSALEHNGHRKFTSDLLKEASARRFCKEFPVELLVNYFGQFKELERENSLFKRSKILPNQPGESAGKTMPRLALVEVSIVQEYGQLRFNVEWNKRMAHQGRIRNFVQSISQILSQAANLLAHTPSEAPMEEYPLLQLNDRDFQNLVEVQLPKASTEIGEIEDIYPATVLQEGILLSQLRKPGHYNISLIFKLASPNGPVELDRLIAAWKKVICKHPILRSFFLDNDTGATLQVVLKHYEGDIRVLAADGEEAFSKVASIESADYRLHAPPHRLTICRSAENTVLCRLELSHAITDVNTSHLLIQDFIKSYENTDDLKLIEAEPSFGKYVDWINQQDSKASLPFWKRYLEHAELSIFPVTSQNTMEGWHNVNIPIPDNQKLVTFCKEHKITIPSLMRAAWALVLRAYLATEQVCFGYIVTGRDAPVENIDRIAGPLVNMLICRTVPDKFQTCVEFLQAVQEDYLMSAEHQNTSLADIQHELGISGALFNTVVTMYHQRDMDPASELEYEHLYEYDPTEFELVLTVALGERNFALSIASWESRISEKAAMRIGQTLADILERLVSYPQQNMAVQQLAASEDIRAMQRWSAVVPSAANICVHTKIENMAALDPDSPAVCAWDGNLTYGELDRLSSGLARRLHALGVSLEDCVPFCFEKSYMAVVVEVAILKAGGAIVPLDLRAPQARLETVIRESAATHVVVSQSLASSMSFFKGTLVVVSAESLKEQNQGSSWSLSSTRPENKAFVLYTSGSTGKPKGVIQEHRTWATNAEHHSRDFGLNTKTRTFQFSSFVFDISFMDVITTLMYGGCLCIPSEQERVDDVAAAIRKYNANWAILTPSLARTIDPNSVSNLDGLALGGEAVTVEDIERWKGHLRLINTYGPCEAGSMITRDYTRLEGPPSLIGFPVGCCIWIVDPVNPHRVAPIGTVGEICIEGHSLARGYMNDAQRTQQSFMVNPTWLPASRRAPGARVYRTGDLAFFDKDGAIHFVGRSDTQVKLRGQRIELGEIEHLFRQCLPTADAIVDAIDMRANNGRQTLIAFVCNNTVSTVIQTNDLSLGAPLPKKDMKELRSNLREQLPKYMIPALVVTLSFLPRNASSKIDRRRLKDWARNLTSEDLAPFVKMAEEETRPPTATELLLRKLWARVLTIKPETISIHDDFFQLGGDSITAMQLVAATRGENHSLTVAQVLEFPVLAEMALAVTELGTIRKEDVRPYSLLGDMEHSKHIRQAAVRQCGVFEHDIEDIYPCSPLQEGLFTLSLKSANAYIAAHHFSLKTPKEKESVLYAWRRVVAASDIMRIRIVQDDSGSLYQVVLRQTFSQPAHLDTDPASKFLVDFGSPLSWLGWSLNDEGLVECLTWHCHHAAYDAWSMSLIHEQLEKALLGQELSILPQYSAFIAGVRSTETESSKEFWSQEFAGFDSPPYPLAVGTSKTESVGKKHTFTIPITESSSSLLSVRLQSAWAVTQSLMSGSQDVAFGVVGSGRDIPVHDIEKIMGPTISSYPLRFQVNKSETINGFLEGASARLPELNKHQHLGLQNIMSLSAAAKRACEFETLLVIQFRDAEHSNQTVEYRSQDSSIHFANYSLVILCTPSEKKVEIQLIYDSRLIPQHDIDRLSRTFQRIVSEMENPGKGRPLSELYTASAAQTEDLLKWNQPTGEPPQKCVHDMIKRWVTFNPARVAVESDSDQLTCSELDRLANKLAYHILSKNVNRQTFVPIYMEKSVLVPVCALAVMKAGAAFVLVASSEPAARLEKILSSLRPDLVLTTKKLQSNLGQYERKAIVVDSLESLKMLDESPSNAQWPAVSPSDPVFATFSSGSTGVPKGSVQTHSNFCAGALSHGPALGFSERARVLQFCSFSFDASILEILTTLVSGATVCVPSEEARLDDLAGTIRKLKIDMLITTASVSRLLEPANVPNLKVLVLGGEPVTREDIVRWHACLKFILAYGPSEGGIAVSSKQITSPEDDIRTIGSPINCRCWILDEEQNIVPPGFEGELYVEGPCVAKGYLADVNSNAFGNRPKSLPPASPGARIYRTGDIVKQNPSDGSLSFVGRQDNMIKIHGQKVEIEEVETQIQRLVPTGTEVKVVYAKLSDQPSAQLLAFITADTGETGESEQLVVPPSLSLNSMLLEYLNNATDVLPRHMVPSTFIPISHIPLTTNGKANRALLKNIAEKQSSSSLRLYYSAAGHERPLETPTEITLAGCWKEVLGSAASHLTKDDHFLRLGGDSMAAIKLVSKLRVAGFSIGVAEIFKHPRLTSMASVLRETKSSSAAPAPFSLLSQDSKRPEVISEATSMCGLAESEIQDIYPCTPLQEEVMASATRREGSYIAKIAFRIGADVDISVLKQALSKVCSTLPIMRTRIIYSEAHGGFLQVVASSLPPCTSTHEIEEPQFGLGTALWQFNISEDKSGGFMLLTILAHHSVYDGWSIMLIHKLLTQTYQNPELEPEVASWNSFVRYNQELNKEAAKSYWSSALSGFDGVAFPQMPQGSPIPVQKQYHSSFILDRPDTSIATTGTMINAALALTLSCWSENDDVMFGTIQGGRNVPVDGIENIVGPTISSFPIRVQVDQTCTVSDYLSSVHSWLMDSIQHQHVGLRFIQQECSTQCDLQTFLVVQGDEGEPDSSIVSAAPEMYSQPGFGIYPLIIMCEPRGDTVNVSVEYNESIIPLGTVKSIIDQMGHICRQLSLPSNSKGKLHEVELLGPQDSARIMEWNSQKPSIVPRMMHELILDQVTSQPNARAISSSRRNLSYKELDILANQIKDKALSQIPVHENADQDIFVPLCLEKSWWTTVAMLAVLRMGCAFVLLDAAHPTNRLAEICQTVEAKFMFVSSAEQAARFSHAVEHVIILDTNFVKSAQMVYPERTVYRQPSLDSAAYIVFTSGSTGKPKGSITDHRGFSSSAKAHSEAVGIVKGSRVLQFASYSFDPSILEQMWTLAAGGTVCIPSEEQRIHLAKTIQDFGITWAGLTPSTVALLSPSEVSSLQHLLIAGEAPSRALIQTWAGVEGLQLHPAYGPSECGIIATIHENATKDTEHTSIGRGFGSRCWIVHPDNIDKLLPIGCVGELILESPSAARGYINEPEKTSIAFPPKPSWVPEDGYRVYRTGDLVKYASDGNIHFVGRKDKQVKLRGQRIEIGEIEHALSDILPRDLYKSLAVVYVKESGTDVIPGPSLIAFVGLGSDNQQLGLDLGTDVIDDLRISPKHDKSKTFTSQLSKLFESLRERLPHYMVPLACLPVTNIPQTRSDKVDERRLIKCLAGLKAEELALYSGIEQEKNSTTPLSPLGLRLRRLWSVTLNVEESTVSASSNFVSLGGDSIKAIRLVSAARSEGLEFQVQDVFRCRSLRSLTDAVSTAMETETAAPAPFSLLPEDKREEIRTHASRQTGLSPDAIEDIYPCTALQSGLITLASRHPGKFIARDVIKVPSAISLEKFESAWATLTAVNPILRTSVVQASAGLVQVVSSAPINWEKSNDLDEYIRRNQRQPFSLGEKLSRYALVHQGGAYYFVWTRHHAIFDGWSNSIVWTQLQAILEGQKPAEVPPFSMFVRYLCTIETEETKSFWKEYLSGDSDSAFPPSSALELTEDRVESSITQSIKLPPSGNEYKDVTLSTLLRASWAIVAATYSNSNDVTFGVTLTGRNAPVAGIEAISGPTITTVPVRVELKQQETVKSLLQRVENHSTRAISYEHFGLHNIAALHSSSSNSAGSFNTLLVVQPQEDASSDLNFERVQREEDSLSEFNTYNLLLNCQIRQDDVYVTASFKEDALSATSMNQILQHWESVFLEMCRKPEIEALLLRRAGPADQETIRNWNNVTPAAVDSCVHWEISRHVQSQPDKVAIEAWNGSLTYSELDSKADRLASYLMFVGSGPDTIIPVCFEKSLWNIVSIVGILKSGAAATNLDPKHPPERMGQILQQTGARIVVCEPQFAHLFYGKVEIVISMDPTLLEHLPRGQVSTESSKRSSPHDMAFLMFTSGSTGTPKGIIQEHTSVVTSAYEHAPAWHIDSSTRAFQFASHTFDVFVIEVFTTLIKGGCICIPSESQRSDNPTLAMREFDINWVFLTPSFVRNIKPSDVPSLKTLVLGGEAVQPDNIEVWADKVLLTNGYGPCEASVAVSCDLLPGQSQSGVVPIGRAVGCVTWVVHPDNHHILSPIGAIGELVLQGNTLARGYLHSPDKTAASFFSTAQWVSELPDADTRHPHRFYKTGDLVRYLPDGNLVYMGRKDSQIRVRGQRVEIGEVEYHLRKAVDEFESESLEAVAELVQPKGHPSKILVAVIAPKISQEAVSTDLPVISPFPQKKHEEYRARLGCSLTVYMTPTLYLHFSYMPTTTSKKTDRRIIRQLLSSMEMQSLVNTEDSSDSEFASSVEEKLAGLWSEALGIPTTSINSNSHFLQLGGDSLAAMRFVSYARDAGILLSLRDVFVNPVLHSMAQVCSDIQSTDDGDIPKFSLVSDSAIADAKACLQREHGVDPDQVEDLYPATPTQQALLLQSSTIDGTYVGHSYQKLPRDIDLKKLSTAIGLVRDTCDILRARIVHTQNHGVLQAICKGDEAPIARIKVKTIREATDSLDLEPYMYGSTLFRCVFAEDPSQTTYFCISMHHAIYDGRTLPTLLNMISLAYYGLPLPTVTPFRNFISHLPLNSQDEQVASNFWRDHLNNFERSGNTFPSTQKTRLNLGSIATLNKPIQITRKPGSSITTSNILRAGWALLLKKLERVNDVVFGETLSGRDMSMAGIEEVVGPTITTVPWRITFNNSMSVPAYLSHVQQLVTDMMQHQHYGIGKIRQLNDGSKNASNFSTLLVIQPPNRTERDGSQQRPELFQPVLVSSNKAFHSMPFVMHIYLNDSGAEVEVIYDESCVTARQAENVVTQLGLITQELSKEQSSDEVTALISSISSLENRPTPTTIRPPATHSETVLEAISRNAQMFPDSLAISAHDGNLSYSELDLLSSKAARRLVSLGLPERSYVPILAEKSRWACIAQLAILKSGCAFANLDPSHPSNRLMQQIKTLDGHLLVCTRAQAPKGTELADCIFVIGPNLEDDERNSKSIALPTVSLQQEAVVVFTSGSTGTPKGVMIPHSALATSISANSATAEVNWKSRVLQFAAYTFDVSVGDTFFAWTRGACLCIPSEDDRLNDLAGFMDSMAVTHAFLTPSVAALLDPREIPSLKVLACAGEPMRQTLVDRWAAQVNLINFYGPAETTIYCCGNPQMRPSEHANNIGRPIGCNIWIVARDDHDQLLLPGAEGEIVVEGELVAKGYLNNEVKTAQQFVQPKWKPDTTIYKTGDIGRQNLDGSFTYIGRGDSQIKYHGQRIEPGEIEGRLIRPGMIKEAAVLVPKKGEFANKLCALLELTESHSFSVPSGQSLLHGTGSPNNDIANARESLAANVPSYMLPSEWFFVINMPMTSSGKIDKKMLLEWVESYGSQRSEKTLPKTESPLDLESPLSPLELRIFDIWSEYLNMGSPKTSVSKSFLGLGGDSIIAMQITSKCRASGLMINVRDVIASKSIRELASKVHDSITLDQTEIKRYEPLFDTEFQLSPVQAFYFRTTKDKNSLFQQTTLLDVPSRFSASEVESAVRALVQAHPMLRVRFKKNAEEVWMQSVPKVMADDFWHIHRESDNKDLDAVARCALGRINIETGPVFAAEFLAVGNKQFLLLTAHHLAIDIVSWNIVTQHLNELLNGHSITPTESIPYSEWCQQQVETNGEEHSTVDFSYWGIDAASNTYEHIMGTGFALDEEYTSVLLDTASSTSGPQIVDVIVAALLASFQAVFTDRELPSIFNESHGRDGPLDVTGTVGWFTQIQKYNVRAPAKQDDMLGWFLEVAAAKNRSSGDSGCFELSEILLNYQGMQHSSARQEDLLTALPLPEIAQSQDSSVVRFSLIEVSGAIQDGTLKVHVNFSKLMQHQHKLRQWVETCRQKMISMIQVVRDQKSVVRDISTSEVSSELHPCTPMQLHILRQNAQETQLYNVRFAFRIFGSETIDINSLKESWMRLVARHPVLRTGFVHSVTMDTFHQMVYPPNTNIPIDFVNRSTDARAPIGFLSATSMQIPCRLTIVTKSPREFDCIMDINHALMDGTGMTVMLNEWASDLNGERLSTSRPSYVDFTNHITSRDASSAKTYWRKYLSSMRPTTLPTTVGPDRGELETIALNLPHLTSLKDACIAHGTTTAVALRAAWAIVLRSFAAEQENICFGYISSGRNIPMHGIHDIIGPCFNLLGFNVRITADSTVEDVLESAHQDFIDALPHEAFSMPEMLDRCGLKKKLPFNTIMNYRKYHVVKANDTNQEGKGRGADGVTIELVDGRDPMEHDLVVAIAEKGETIHIALTIWTGRVSDSLLRTIERKFDLVLKAIQTNSRAKVKGLL